MIPAEDSPRREALLVLLLTILGGALRVWAPHRLGLEHFDEGIYATSGLWIFRPGGLFNIDPNVIPYAPPGFPTLLGISYLLLGVSDLAAIFVSIAAGTATIPLLGWLARHSFGPGAGVAAAALAAFSGPHLAFSRMAMTDASFLLAWLAAIGLGIRLLEKPRLGRALAFGVAVGLAQHFKYNGWIPGLIVAVAALTGLVGQSPVQRRASIRAIGLGVVSAAVAALVYLPWYRYVESQGSYASLLEHHRGYLGGPSSWIPSWRIQMAQAVALSGHLVWRLSGAGVAFASAWIGWGIVQGESILSDRRALVRFLVGLLVGSFSIALLPNAPWWMALAILPWAVFSERAAVRVLASWWVILSVMTPFYHPYARLWLPLHLLSWMVVAALITSFGPGPPRERSRTHRRVFTPSVSLSCLILGFVVAAIDQLVVSPRPRPLDGLLGPSDGLKQAAARFAEPDDDTPTPSRAVEVLARPPLSYYLYQEDAGRISTHPELASLLELSGRGRVALVDEVQLPVDPRGLLSAASPRWSVEVLAWDRLPLPVLLDADPGACFGQSRFEGSPTDREPGERELFPSARIWLLKSD